jgi:hypothetical protein
MIKKLFDTVKLNIQLKIKTEALKTINADLDMLLELVEHPLKKQNTIKSLLKDMKTIVSKSLKE